ncbi:hypothetical protein ACIP1T_28570 [Pseudomonas japonica]|uniref:hypothetical protein n=1 Tax=Pseudomonas japonica TaxID=256466 RepID=UPI00381CECB7
MPIRFDNMAPAVEPPHAPVLWRWLLLLLLLLASGIAAAVLFSTTPLPEQGAQFWGMFCGLPLLFWSILAGGRVLLHVGQRSVARGWNEARAEDLQWRRLQGRRSVQLLASSAHTALREQLEEPTAVQLQRLLEGGRAVKTQPCRLQQRSVRHSRLPGGSPDPELVLLERLTGVLDELAGALGRLPADTPLAFLFESDSGLPEGTLRKVWREAWRRSGIRQTMEPVEGSGLAALDLWLDQRLDDRALLLIVAFQFAPTHPLNTAEAVVGVLLGNHLTQTSLSPAAFLHRPEQVSEATREGMAVAVGHALDWATLDTESIEDLWTVGIAPSMSVVVSVALDEVFMSHAASRRSHDLDSALGCGGPASPWLAISLAAQAIEQGAAAQFILSSTSPQDNGLWSVVLTPAPPL